MKTILKTINPVTLSFAEAILKDAGIESFVLDRHASMVDGSIGAVPRRLVVIDSDRDAAIRALELAGLSDEVFRG